jgi:hypothetical protein
MAAPQLVSDETRLTRDREADAESVAGSMRDFDTMADSRCAGAVMASDAGADNRTGGGYAWTNRKPRATPLVTMPRIVLGRWAMDAWYTSPFPVEYMRCECIFFSE